MLAFVVATLLLGGLVVAAIRLFPSASTPGDSSPAQTPQTEDPVGGTAATPSPNLETMTLATIQGLAKSRGLAGVSRLRKAELIEKLLTA
jgi:hypothetical protein